MRKFYWWEDNLKDEEQSTINPDTSTSPLNVESSPKYKKLKKDKEELETKIKNHKEKQRIIIDDALKRAS